jgi:hypothetical protein
LKLARWPCSKGGRKNGTAEAIKSVLKRRREREEGEIESEGERKEESLSVTISVIE